MADDIQDLDNPQVLPIFRFRVNFKNNVGNELKYARQILQYAFTIKNPIVYSNDAPFKGVYTLQFHTKAEEKTFLDFWLSQKADAKKFWFLSHVNSFSLAFPVASPSFNAIVYHNQFDRIRLGHERIYILKLNGDLITRKITNYVDNADMTATLTFQTQLPAVSPSEVVSFGLFHVGKFASDMIDVKHVTNVLGSVVVTLEELIKEYP